MIKIDKLIVTQNGLRNEKQLNSMHTFLTGGKRFLLENLKPPGPLIQIAMFEDGKMYIADGHHRTIAIVLSGRDYLDEGEYEIQQWTYRQWGEVNFQCGWVTPYDPRTHVRVADYSRYKDNIRQHLHIGIDATLLYIKTNKDRYAKPREITTIQDMMDDLGIDKSRVDSFSYGLSDYY